MADLVHDEWTAVAKGTYTQALAALQGNAAVDGERRDGLSARFKG